jgi:hypothetical protein
LNVLKSQIDLSGLDAGIYPDVVKNCFEST